MLSVLNFAMIEAFRHGSSILEIVTLTGSWTIFTLSPDLNQRTDVRFHLVFPFSFELGVFEVEFCFSSSLHSLQLANEAK